MGIETPTVETPESSPEDKIKAEIITDWTETLNEIKESLENPKLVSYGSDFAIARCEAVIEQVQNGRLFEDVVISATYDGVPKQLIEPSVYHKYKEIADEKRVQGFSELMKDHPEEVEKRIQLAKQAQILVEEMEALKFAE